MIEDALKVYPKIRCRSKISGQAQSRVGSDGTSFIQDVCDSVLEVRQLLVDADALLALPISRKGLVVTRIGAESPSENPPLVWTCPNQKL
jgi:hypothetical protein